MDNMNAPTAGDADDDADDADDDADNAERIELPKTRLPTTAYTIAKTPAHKNVSVAYLQTAHGAEDFIPALTDFLRRRFQYPIAPSQYDRYDIFNQIKLHLPPNRYLSNQPRSCRIRAVAAVPPKDRKPGIPAILDTALVIEDPSQYVPSSGIEGLRPAQIRAIFKLPPQFGNYPHPLAYIEWFTPLNHPDRNTGMYTTHRSTRVHRRNAAIVSVEQIVRSCHLMADSRGTIDPTWTSTNVLDKAKLFHVNPYVLVDTFTRQNLT
ncbi:hypothetical protein R3P38DRAFT_3238924 [Favolaschia claudopus]|uniref:Uncharacterized protein n=1 Tax=Favolaschia claudopus TaxID=2862362 RepID=A0AAV9ZAE6_9AGAR